MARLIGAYSPLALAALLPLALGSACGKNDPAADTESDAGTGSDSTSEDDGSVPWEATPALGINITEVEANPGISVPISSGAEWVDGTMRAGRLPRDRDTLIRVQYTIDPDFVPREIECRLILSYADGTSETQVQRKMVTEDSNPAYTDRGFFFGLTAEQEEVQPGMTFQVQLWEVTETDGVDTLAEGVHTSPAEGPMLVGVEDHPMEMNIMFVPISYNGLLPDISEDDEKYMVENGLLQHNPLQSVNAMWHDYVVYDEVLTELGDLLPIMSQLRSSEGNFSTNIYYSALVQTGGSGVGGTAGIAYRQGTQLGADRVNAVVWNVTGSSTNTLVHEVGHNQSFAHVQCEGGTYPPGQEPPPDHPDHPLGRILTYGFGIRDFQMRDYEDTVDYMSYCDPSWVSPWTWNRAYEHIRTLTSWDYEGDLQVPPQVDTLKAVIFDDGHGRWWVGPSSMDAEFTSGNYVFEYDAPDGHHSALGRARPIADSTGTWVEIPLGELDVDTLSNLKVSAPTYTASLKDSRLSTLNIKAPAPPPN